MSSNSTFSITNGSNNANHASGSSIGSIEVRDGNGGPTRLEFTLVGMDPDGFTINFSTASASFPYQIGYKAIE